MTLTRRRLLTLGGVLVAGSGAGAGLVETRVLPGRGPFHRALGLTGSDGVVPSVTPGPVESGRLPSGARWSLVFPPGAVRRGLPVVVLLHGRGGDHSFPVRDLGIDRYLAASGASLVLASVDGGPSSYWHRRASGDDPLRVITSELLPTLTRRGLRTDRLGLLGWSMGGYGALLLASSLGPGRLAAAVASSPALWRSFPDTAAGAFDSAADFQSHDIFTRVSSLERVPLRIDCGRDDPFAPAVNSLRKRLSPAPAGGLQPGEHTAGYWRRLLPTQLTFLAAHL